MFYFIPHIVKGDETIHTQSDAEGFAPRSHFALADYTSFLFLPKNQIKKNLLFNILSCCMDILFYLSIIIMDIDTNGVHH